MASKRIKRSMGQTRTRNERGIERNDIRSVRRMTLTSDASRDKIDERFDGWTGLVCRSVLSLRDQCTRTSVTHRIQSRKAKARLFQWSAGYGSPFAMWSGWKSPLNVMHANALRLAHAVRSIRPSSRLTLRPPTILTIDLLTDITHCTQPKRFN